MESGHPRNYSKFSDNQGSLWPPLHSVNIPQNDSTDDEKSDPRNFCSRHLCFLYCFIFLLVFLLVLLTFYLHTMYKPQIPTYGIDDLSVKTFNVMKDLSLSAEFDIVVRATNPNEHIGLAYGKDSSVIVMYSDSELCSGKLPAFHQPVVNATLMNVVLKGHTKYGSGLQEALTENRRNKSIPLLVRLEVPLSVVLGSLPLRKIVMFVRCSLEVDSLQPGKKTKILYSDYSYDVRI
ncbi:Late embryogenesis abundant (LEA) hydroxyproline-rich glycoprotein family [Parasponia andersonii]|uniref:Late embryogenesis abundant (LEA) hydroxyproline-rich glycoprotein family n=1 Tax=Parasponia andersonii TaxID=3476 RepID=A0A2P5DY88_PARAD|nr:Late embryogenesis abundant (LEA) hydroxyproline-rich glycoprotein family [Parasponia andersonii]